LVDWHVVALANTNIFNVGEASGFTRLSERSKAGRFAYGFVLGDTSIWPSAPLALARNRAKAQIDELIAG
jgi:hypothetical protein